MDGAGLFLMANIARSPAGENHFIRRRKLKGIRNNMKGKGIRERI